MFGAYFYLLAAILVAASLPRRAVHARQSMARPGPTRAVVVVVAL
ncbi:MAG TPA: hypothetical protein VKQ30_14535 [Ktedonobacterales bacterium]|nr:hypothetical protein [Ktedonobacterales bacterium]